MRKVSEIANLNRQWKKEGKSLAERARAASQFRQDRRLEAREMMKDPDEVELLRNRDRVKYGDPNGPTFEWLRERLKNEGLSENEAYEEIIKKAGMTDTEINKSLGV